MDNRNKLKYLTDAAMISGIYMVIFLVSRFLFPGFEQAVYFALPVPISIYVLRHSVNKAIIPLVATFLLSFILGSPFTSAFIVLPALIIGILGVIITNFFTIRKKLGTFLIFLLFLIFDFIATISYSAILGINFFKDALDLSKGFAEFLGTIGFNNINHEFLQAFFIAIVPTIFILYAVCNTYLYSLLIGSSRRLVSSEIQIKVSNNKSSLNNLSQKVGILTTLLLIGVLSTLPFILNNGLVFYIFFALLINFFLLCSFYIYYHGFQYIAILAFRKRVRWILFLSFFAFLFLNPLFFIFSLAVADLNLYHREVDKVFNSLLKSGEVQIHKTTQDTSREDKEPIDVDILHSENEEEDK